MASQRTCPRPRPSVKTVTDNFVHQFYTVLSSCPRYAHRFYESNSRLTINESMEDGSQEVVTACNQEEIDSTIMRFFSDAKIRSLVVCPQMSTGDGIVLLVTGEMSREGKPDCSFSQSFFLAHKKSFYVLNDILRITPLHRPTTGVQPIKIESNSAQVDVTPLRTQSAPLSAQLGPLSPLRSSMQCQAHSLSPSPTKLRRTTSVSKDSQECGNTVVNPPQTPKRESGEGGLAARGSPTPQHSEPSQYYGRGHETPLRKMLQRASSVFVRGIPECVDEQALEEAFSQYGQVREGGVTIKGRKDRFGFVDFDSVASVDSVLNKVVCVNGCELAVEEMRPMVFKRPGKPQVKRSLSWNKYMRDANLSAGVPYKTAGNPFRAHQMPMSYATPIRCD